jgi:hypothetical protein
MAITSIQRDQNNNVSIVRITVDTDLSAVIVPNYITSQQDNIYRLNKGTWTWFETDTLLISGNDANAFFEFTDLTFSTIEKIAPSPNGIVNPGLINQVAYYAATGNEVSGRRSSAPNIIYLAPSPYGSDSGDGSILAPFATLSHAMSTITTASQTNLFEIRFQMGSYIDSSVALKPYINVNGQGSSLSISGSITADASWSSGGIIHFGNFDNISTSISINFDVSSSSTTCIASFYNMRFAQNNSVNIYGGNLILVLDALYSFNGDLNVYVENAYGAINSSSVLNFTYLAWSVSLGYNFQISQSYVFDSCNFSTSGGAIGVASYITAAKLIGTLNATGTNTNLSIDCASLTSSSLPNILAGATVQYINVANTLTANYAPLNYIPDASGSTSPVTSVAAHLHGIDNALSNAVFIPAANIVFVATNGTDAPGNGSIAKPYQTLLYAISSITTANHLNLFNIVLLNGIYNETTLSLKPFVSINGFGSTLNVTGDVNLDSSWSTLGMNGGEINFVNFAAINTTGDVILDFSVAGLNPCKLVMENIDFPSINSFAITANRVFNCNLDQISSFNPTLENVNGIMNDCSAGNMTFNATSGLSGSIFTIQNTSFTGDLAYVGNPFAISSIQKLYGSKIDGILSADQSNVSLYIDSNSLTPSSLPVLTNGASAIYINSGNTVDANYTPSNYTPNSSGTTFPDTSVAGNLHGIDDALGITNHSSVFSVYVSPDGNDTTGTGIVTNPYQTIVKALSTITTNDASNIFNIILTGGVYNEISQIMLKPWVNLVGFDRNTTINNSFDIISDASWNGTTAGTVSIENLNITNKLTLDFSLSTADSPIFYINNIQVSSDFTINGNAINPSIFFIRSSFFSDGIFNNALVESFSNYYISGFVFGLGSFSTSSTYFSNGDYYNSQVTFFGDPTSITSQRYFIRSSFIDPTVPSALTVTGAGATLNIDPTSYVLPTISSSATLVLSSVSGGVGAGDYTPSNYTPSATAPTIPTSLQGHLRGIDNILANFNVGNKSLGTTTNDNAVAGHVGEYISNSSTGVSLSNGTAATITSVSLTAGDWEVSGVIEFIPAGITTVQQYISSISKTANTLPTVLTENNIQSLIANFTTGSTNILNCGATRISIASTTTVYLVGRSAFGVSTMTASGFIGARRVR